MKSISLILLGLCSALAFAAQEGEITMKSPAATEASSGSTNLTEAGLNFSSINDGSVFGTVALMHEWDNGFALGVRGYLPMQYTKIDSAYMAQALARFIFINETNQMYLEPTATQGYFSGPSGTTAFGMIGVNYGYSRQIMKDIRVGAQLGMDYSNRRVSHDEVAYENSVFYNHIGVTGVYYF